MQISHPIAKSYYYENRGDSMKFGEILRELLEERDISQKEAAEDLNLAASTFGNYVRSVREPDCETLKRIADYFEVSIDYLLDHHTDVSKTHAEERLLQIFHNLPQKERAFFLDQGVLLLKYARKGKK